MNCPKCKDLEVKVGIDCVGKANTCSSCGWFKVTSITLESGFTLMDKMKLQNMRTEIVHPQMKPINQLCTMCGKNRDRLDSTGVKLILGVHGGVCVECVNLCREIIGEAEIKI